MSSLRALIRAVLLEDDEKLKKWVLADGNPVERELVKIGIVPLRRGAEQISKLGEGQNNVVLDVVYNGKRAAARISEEMEELDSLTTFVAHVKAMPTKYHKHFPNIYKTFEIKTRSRWDNQYYYGAVVEMLDPLPPGLEFDLDFQSINGNLQRARVAALMADNWVLEGIIQDSTEQRDVQAELLHLYEENIRSQLLSWVNKPLSDFDEWLNNVIDKHTVGMTQNESKPYYIFNKGLLTALKGAVIPTEPTQSRQQSRMPDNHVSAKVREFYEFLQALEESGMKHGDLHTGNFMVRRSTGDFVIVDPGYFDSSNDESGSRSFYPSSGS